MSQSPQSKFARFILRALDMLVSLYTGRLVHWDQDPYKKTDAREWRAGCFLVAAFLNLMLLPIRFGRSLDPLLNSVTNGHHSIVWLYVAFISIVLAGAFAFVKLGPKVPLWLSIPSAAVGLVLCLWYGWQI